MTTSEDYERGYANGENSGYADWTGALMEVLPEGVDLSPMIRDLLLDLEERRA
jgi:hypothetical protein